MKSLPHSAVQQPLGRGPSSQLQREELQIKITQFISRKVAAATLPLLEPIPRHWETGRDSHRKAAVKQTVPKSPGEADSRTDLSGCRVQAAAPRPSHPLHANLDAHGPGHSTAGAHPQHLLPLHLASPFAS